MHRELSASTSSALAMRSTRGQDGGFRDEWRGEPSDAVADDCQALAVSCMPCSRQWTELTRSSQAWLHTRIRRGSPIARMGDGPASEWWSQLRPRLPQVSDVWCRGVETKATTGTDLDKRRGTATASGGRFGVGWQRQGGSSVGMSRRPSGTYSRRSAATLRICFPSRISSTSNIQPATYDISSASATLAM